MAIYNWKPWLLPSNQINPMMPKMVWICQSYYWQFSINQWPFSIKHHKNDYLWQVCYSLAIEHSYEKWMTIAIYFVDLPITMLSFNSFVSLPEGNCLITYGLWRMEVSFKLGDPQTTMRFNTKMFYFWVILGYPHFRQPQSIYIYIHTYPQDPCMEYLPTFGPFMG